MGCKPNLGHGPRQQKHHHTMAILNFASSFVPASLPVTNHALCASQPALRFRRGPSMQADAREMVGIGVIGCGRIGQVHASTISALPDANLIAVADPFEKYGRMVADEFKTTWEADWEAVVANDAVRGVVIGSPTPFHAEQIIRCAEMGKDIFCEKPISNDLTTIDRCLDAVAKHNVRLLVGFQRRFDSNFIRIRDQIRVGAIGQVRTFAIVSRDPAPPPAEYLAKSGGIFLDMQSHDLDMARFVTGAEIDEVFVVGDAFEKPAQDAGDLDTVITVLRMSNGSFGTITNSRRCAYGYDQRIEVFGSKGSLVGNNKEPDSVVVNTMAGSATGLPYSFFMDRYKDAYGNAMAAFVDMIRTGSQPTVTGVDGRAPVVAGMAAAKSVKERRPVKLAECDVVLQV